MICSGVFSVRSVSVNKSMSNNYPQSAVLPVVAGIIQSGQRILCARKAPGKALAGYWEFPGGKIDPGESAETALARELHEELHIIADVGPYFAENRHDNGVRTILLKAYWVPAFKGQPALTDHDAIEWLRAEELSTLLWAPADRPLVDKLQSLTSLPGLQTLR